MSKIVGVASWRPLHLVLLLAYGVFLTWPALSTGYIPSRDVLIYLLWSTNFTEQLWAGDGESPRQPNCPSDPQLRRA